MKQLAYQWVGLCKKKGTKIIGVSVGVPLTSEVLRGQGKGDPLIQVEHLGEHKKLMNNMLCKEVGYM